MRPRAGTGPVTLEPSMVVEVLSLARQHDDMLKEARQDLLRAETQLRSERKWKWMARAACVAIGAGGVIAVQDDALRASLSGVVTTALEAVASAGSTSLAILVAAGLLFYGAIWGLRRLMRGPSPEKLTRRLMKQFADRDGVASYIFAGDEHADQHAQSIGALASEKNKGFRQRHLTASHRSLSSSLQRLLNSSDGSTPVLH